MYKIIILRIIYYCIIYPISLVDKILSWLKSSIFNKNSNSYYIDIKHKFSKKDFD